MKRPAFQFYPADYMGSQRVQMMTLEEEGAYIRLLCYCWRHGSIPSNPEMAARLIGKGGSTTVAANVLKMFIKHPSDDTQLLHERLEQEREKQRVWAEKSSLGGKRSAKSRVSSSINATKGGSTTLPTKPKPKANSISSSISTNILEEIYQSYPVKVGKPKAIEAIRKAIKKIEPDKLLALTKEYAAARNGDLEFVPNPATWFNQERYNDAPETWKPKQNGSTPTLGGWDKRRVEDSY